jgi:hypothetical protein
LLFCLKFGPKNPCQGICLDFEPENLSLSLFFCRQVAEPSIKGYNGLRIEVDAGFKSEMDKMNQFAKDCSVTVQVTHAFRKEGQNIGGTIVPPASNSNHLVGHAIDFNLETPNGWCNGDCLDWENNSYGRVSSRNDKLNNLGPPIVVKKIIFILRFLRG